MSSSPVSDIRILAGLPGNGFMLDNGVQGDFLPDNGQDNNGAIIEGDALQDEMEIIDRIRDRLPPEVRDRLPEPGVDGAGQNGPLGGEFNGGGIDPIQDDDDAADEDEDAGDEGAGDDALDEDEAADEGLLTQRMLISGRISSISRSRRITVLVPTGGREQRVRFELAPDAIVLLETDDIRQASPGDQVYAAGQSVEPPRFFATQIDVLHVSENLSEEAVARMDEAVLDGGALGDGLLAGGNDGGAANGDDGDDENRPVDPFDVVRQEREAREAEEAENEGNAGRRNADGKIFHGRVIRIN